MSAHLRQDADIKALQASLNQLQTAVQQLEQRVDELEGTESAPGPAATDPALKPIAQQQFEAICMACHPYQPEASMLAPPIFAVKGHYNRVHESDDAWIDAGGQYLRHLDLETPVQCDVQHDEVNCH